MAKTSGKRLPNSGSLPASDMAVVPPVVAAAPAVASKKRPLSQAVVVIHGMGEQRPMETLRGFVRAVWSTDLRLTAGLFGRRTSDEDGIEINKSWIVPDTRTGLHELRRITTPAGTNGRRTDFYELYWADITQGTTLERLRAWGMGLLFRKWSDVPRNVRKLFVVLWLAVLAALAPGIVLTVMKAFDYDVVLWPAWTWAMIAGAITLFVGAFLVPYFGDVAAYVRAEPGTVAKRAEVRERGLSLLRTIMSDTSYDRVILVSHSLGSIVAYDLLQLLWAEFGPSHNNPRQEPSVISALRKVGKFAAPLKASDRESFVLKPGFHSAQFDVYQALADTADTTSKPWKISDFVTLGSPLTHAEFLVTHNIKALQQGIDERLFAWCPPLSERKTPTVFYIDRSGRKHAHHGAVFAATRWTNIFDVGNLWSTGDPISGSQEENFGPGVRNFQVRMTRRRLGFRLRLFTHTYYWSMGKVEGAEILPDGTVGSRSHIDVLRDALDLGR